MNRKERTLPANELRLAGTEEFNGALYEHAENGTEVLSKLQTCSVWANEHHRGVERKLGSALGLAIESGKYLAEARDTFSERQIRDGEWGAWLRENFEGSQETASLYIRLYRRQDELVTPGTSTRLSIEAARKMLAPTKEDKPEEPPENPGLIEAPPEPDEEQLKAVVTVDGKEISLDEAARLIAKKSEPQKIKIGRKELTEQEVIERVKELKASKDSAESKRKDLEKALKEREAKWAQDYALELANLRVKYGVEEEETTMDIPGEAWAEALSKAPSIRLQEAGEVVLRVTQLLGAGILEYSAQEAVDATMKVLPSPTPQTVLTEVGEIMTWLNEFQAELSKQTTPGIRAVN